MDNIEQLPVFLIEAFKDPSVLEALKRAVAIDHDVMADLVANKVGVRIQRMEEALASRDQRIEELETKVADFALKIDEQEQYSRRTSIRISGIEESTNEDPESKIRGVFSAMGLDPVIQRCHRVGAVRKPSGSQLSGQRKPTPRPIICQFTDQRDKQLVMKQRKDACDDYPHVFVNEDLTKFRSSLLYQARQLKRNSKISGAWTRDGRILVMDKQHKIHEISSSKDFIW